MLRHTSKVRAADESEELIERMFQLRLLQLTWHFEIKWKLKMWSWIEQSWPVNFPLFLSFFLFFFLSFEKCGEFFFTGTSLTCVKKSTQFYYYFFFFLSPFKREKATVIKVTAGGMFVSKRFQMRNSSRYQCTCSRGEIRNGVRMLAE